MKPLVSIITPLHNKGPFIAETIRSVLCQTMVDWEMIVVENHSADNGPEIAREYSAKDQRIRLFQAAMEVRGPGAARNSGLQHTTGEWVIFLDADDVILPGHFQKVFQQASRFPDADLITCDWLQGPEWKDGRCELKKPTNHSPEKDFVSAAIAFCPWVPHAAIVKRKALGEPPWWDESFDRLVAEDFPFWFKVLQRANSCYSPHVGVFYRVDTTDRRNTESDLPRYLDSLDKGVEANLQILAACGQDLKYRHRQALFNLHLGLLRFSFPQQQCKLKRRLEARVRTLRPNFREAVECRDWTVTLSYFLPWPVLRKWVERRRKIATRNTCAAEPDERNQPK